MLEHIQYLARSAETLADAHTLVREALKRSEIYTRWRAKRRNAQKYITLRGAKRRTANICIHFVARSTDALNKIYTFGSAKRRSAQKWIHVGARSTDTLKNTYMLEDATCRKARTYIHYREQHVYAHIAIRFAPLLTHRGHTFLLVGLGLE